MVGLSIYMYYFCCWELFSCIPDALPVLVTSRHLDRGHGCKPQAYSSVDSVPDQSSSC